MPLRTSSIHGVSIPCLVPLTTSRTRPPIILADSSIVIGSGDAAQIRLKSLSVSKAHALLLVDDGRAYVRDLASRTEVFVNDAAVREAVLKHGDVLRVGKFGFGVTEDPAAAAAALQRPSPVSPPLLLRVGEEAEFRRVSERVVLIGRRARCDMTLADDSLSGVHAVLFRIGGRWFVRDLNSRTGTFVNGALIRQRRGLEDGDLIRVGRAEIRFVGEERISGHTGLSLGRDEAAPARTAAPGMGAASNGAAPAQVSDQLEPSVAAAGMNSAPAGPAAGPVVTAGPTNSATLGAHDIFGKTEIASAAPVAPDEPGLADEPPLLGLQQVEAAAEGLSGGTAWDMDPEARSEGATEEGEGAVASSEVPEAVGAPAEVSGPMNLTFHPMHERDFEGAPEPARVDDEGGRSASSEVTDEEWDQSVTVWSFEDLARRASGDDGGEEQEGKQGRGLIWVAVAVGVACLGMIVWLILFKLR